MAGTNSLCDVNTDDCTTFPVLGQDFVGSPHLGCKIRPVSVTDSSGWSYMDGPLDSRVQFTDDKTVYCSIRESFIKKVRKSYENIILEIEITNNGVVYSNGVFLTIFNSSCHSCSGRARPLLPTECSPRQDTCRYATQCFTQGAGHPSNTCLQCGDDGWEQKEQVTDIFNSNNVTIKIIAGQDLDYALPLNELDVLLRIQDGPKGSQIKNEKIIWKSVQKNAGKEVLIIHGEDECGHEEELVLTVLVVECECGDNGICSMEHDSPVCSCHQGYSGEINSPITQVLICDCRSCMSGSGRSL